MGSILAILLLYSPCYVQAREFYVSNDGLDKNDGTREKPFRTLARAALHAEGGDTVILRGGIYRETLTVRHSGEDFANKNFSLKTSAPAIDSGKPIIGITDGFLGEATDQGAYESGGARWVPGARGRAEQGAAADADEPPR